MKRILNTLSEFALGLSALVLLAVSVFYLVKFCHGVGDYLANLSAFDPITKLIIHRTPPIASESAVDYVGLVFYGAIGLIVTLSIIVVAVMFLWSCVTLGRGILGRNA